MPPMRRLRQRVAYLSGLAAGLDLPAQSAEGRVLAGVVEVLEAVAEEMERLDERLGELAEYVGELDQDLYDLEETVTGEDGDSDETDDLWDEEGSGAGGGAGEGESGEARPSDFEGAVVFDSGIPTRVDAGPAGRAGGGGGQGRGRSRNGGDELVDGLVLECPHCGTTYVVARDELEFDREPEEDEQEFEWVCPHCGEVVHDFLPDADVDEGDDTLTAGPGGEGARGEAGGEAEAGRAGDDAASPAGAAAGGTPSSAAPF